MKKPQEGWVGVLAEVSSSNVSKAVHKEQEEASHRTQTIPQDEQFVL